MWRGLAAPMGTPTDVIEKLQNAAKAAIDSDEFQSASEKIGFKSAYLPAGQFGDLIAVDDAMIGDLMENLGLRK